MAYPFIQCPTLGEFIERVRDKFDVVEASSTSRAIGPRGEESFRYLRRGQGLPVVLPSMSDTDRLSPVLLSSLCRQLDIPPQEFGFNLGFIEDPLNEQNYPGTEN